MRPIRTYEVVVDGFPSVLYSARTPAKARTRAWRDYCAAYDATFRKFLTISHIHRVDDPPGVGKRILVGGQPATTVYSYRVGGHVSYMRDDSDAIFSSHPLDVEEMPQASDVVGTPPAPGVSSQPSESAGSRTGGGE